MASAPAIPEAVGLAGRWLLTGTNASCAIELLLDDRPLTQGSLAAPMMAARMEAGCPGAHAVAGWNPVPLGLVLADASGFAVITFEQTGPQAYTSIDRAWTLSRG